MAEKKKGKKKKGNRWTELKNIVHEYEHLQIYTGVYIQFNFSHTLRNHIQIFFHPTERLRTEKKVKDKLNTS